MNDDTLRSLADDAPLYGGRYRVISLIGSGGMGTVYRALDSELGETVALKVLRPELAANEAALERFRREVSLARRITNRHVARVFDIGTHLGDRFFTMEYVDGEPLSQLSGREGQLPLARVIELGRGIASGLAAAHAAGVVHRDLKPDNVLIARDGRVVVTDFGIARAVATTGDGGGTVGIALGTPAYMAPEQVEGRVDVDGRVDLYALGALLYELLTGHRAWVGESPIAVAAARLHAPPPSPRRLRPDLPEPWEALVLKCLARQRDDRFATAEDLIRALDGMRPFGLAATTVLARPIKRTPVGAPLREKTLAVLPLRHAGAAEEALLAEEITDDLIDNLSMCPGLRVRPASLVARFREADRDPRQAGAELGVQIVVDGLVRQSQHQIRLNIRLISVEDGFQFWARKLEHSSDDALAIIDQASRAIVDALTLQRRATPLGPSSRDRRQDRESRRFTQALAIVEQAVAALPESAERRLALASTLLQLGQAARAVGELRAAVGYGPELPAAHAALGRLLAEVGAVDEGVRELELALALDRSVPAAADALIRAHALRAEWVEADALAARVLADSGASALGTMLFRGPMWRRREGASAALLQQLGEDDLSVARLMLEVAASGECRGEVEAGLRERVSGRANRARAVALQLLAEATAYAGQLDRALDATREAVGAGLVDLTWIDGCPLLAPLRLNAAFIALRDLVQRRADDVIAAYYTRAQRTPFAG